MLHCGRDVGDVVYWHKANLLLASSNVRYWG
jgi:hypothetical protein